MLRKRLRVLSAVGLAILLCGVVAVWAQTSLGSAQSFAVLGGSTVTNTGTERRSREMWGSAPDPL